MTVDKSRVVAVAITFALLSSVIPGMAGPCCIVMVPPAPPPPPPEPNIPPAHTQVYGELPLFAAIEKRAFGALKVSISRRPRGEAAEAAVASTLGAVGLGPITTLARYKAETGAPLEIVAVVVGSLTYGLYAKLDGPTRVEDLKGKRIAVPPVGTLAHLATIETLKTAGLSSRDVQVVQTGAPSVAAVTAGAADAAPDFIGASFSNLKKIESKKVSFPTWVLYASSDTLAREMKEVMQFIHGLMKGLEAVKSDRDLVGRLLEKEFGVKDPQVQKLMATLVPAILLSSIRPIPEEVAKTVNTLRETGWVTSAPRLVSADRVQSLFKK